jgi:hypothetical protein
VNELLRQYRETGTIIVARKKDKRKKEKIARKPKVAPPTAVHAAPLSQTMPIVVNINGITPVAGAVPWNNPHLVNFAKNSSSSSSSSPSSGVSPD